MLHIFSLVTKIFAQLCTRVITGIYLIFIYADTLLMLRSSRMRKNLARLITLVIRNTYVKNRQLSIVRIIAIS